MCRNIRRLSNFVPPSTDDEVRAAAVQYVRKVTGMAKPSAANQASFDRAVDEVFRATRALVDGVTTSAPAETREAHLAKLRARSARRFGRPV